MIQKIVKVSYLTPRNNLVEMIAVKTLKGYLQVFIEDEILLDPENRIIRTEEIGEIDVTKK